MGGVHEIQWSEVHLSYFHHTTGDRARDIIPLASSLGLGKHCMKNTGLITIGNSSAVVPHVTTLLLNSFRCRQKNCTLAPSDLACLHEFFLDIFATFLTGIGILVVDCWYCRILCHCWLPMLLPSSLSHAAASEPCVRHCHLADSRNKTKVSWARRYAISIIDIVGSGQGQPYHGRSLNNNFVRMCVCRCRF